MTTTTSALANRFRAWHPEEKRMIYPKPGDLLRVNERGEVEYPMGAFTKCIIQWSTGLLDKTGREIFEGDVLKLTDDNGKELTSIVMWWDAGAHFKMVQPKNYRMEHQNDFKLEDIVYLDYQNVIGDIYSNPDLLPSA